MAAAKALIDTPAQSPQQATGGLAGRVLIFASFSIPPETLKNLLDEACEPDVLLVLRGIPQGSNISATVRRLKHMLPHGERVPHVILDPTLFRRYEVERVPTLALERGAGRSPVVAVGAVTPAWLRRMSASVASGAEHLGSRAESYEIAERDLIVEMQQRFAAIDWSARREAAMEHFWSRRQGSFVELPDAREAREFLVDPTVRVTEDLEDAEGNVLVAAGETFNPLNWVPLSKTIIVFRGTDAHHVAKATELARAARAQGRGVILLTTSIETDRGWSHLNELEHALAAPVYVLPKDLVDRFHLAHIPATVASRGKQLLVRELPPQVTP